MTKLYQRLAPVTFLLLCSLAVLAEKDIVTTTNDAGAGSLRDAINSANGRPGLDTVVFDLPADQLCLITLASPLPAITEAVFIDGYSQAGSAAGPIASRVIRININGAAIGVDQNIFTVNADDVTIAGIAMYSAPGYGIQALTNGTISADNLTIWGNFIGTDSTGIATGLGNTRGGIDVNFGSLGSFSNNVIIGSNSDGVNDANEGNLIVSSVNNSSNGDGILLWHTTNSTIAGNFVGTNKNGINTGMGNHRDGIVVTVGCSNVTIGTNGDGTSDALEGNLVSGNLGRGILLAASSTNCVIAGNYIGLDITDGAAGNGTYGIEILNSSNNRIGTDGLGNDAEKRNIISSNTLDGIRINSASFFGFEASSNNNTIAGNVIGSDPGLSTNRGNGANGILLQSTFNSTFTANGNIIGSNYDGNGDAAEGNAILNNTLQGIRIDAPQNGSALTGNKIARNTIFNNGQLGIDLNNDGVTANDNGDGDNGPNDLLNTPVISSIQIDGSNLVITGFTRPGSVVEFYIADAGPNPNPLTPGFTKSFGEGQTFMFRAQEEGTLDGIADLLTASTGTYDGTVEGVGGAGTITENYFRFSVPLSSLPAGVVAGTRVTALAYVNATGTGNTSEFGGVSSITITPVTLLSFKGSLKDGKAYITWTTTNEVDNKHFEIEKSTTGSNFTTIGTVNGKSGIINQYTFTDASAGAAVNYYRLKQVDIDGRPTLSKVLILRGDLEAKAVKAGPNPFINSVNVLYQLEKEQAVQILLYDQAGILVRRYNTRGNTGSNTYNLHDLSNLPKGTYTLQIQGETFKQQLKLARQ